MNGFLSTTKPGDFRFAVLVLASVLLIGSFFWFLFTQVKLHCHIPIGEQNGKKQYLHFNAHQNAIELFTFAQAHDLAHETDLGTYDYKASISDPSFTSLPSKVKPIMVELADCRDSMNKDDYFDEMITHSRLIYWDQSQMPLRIYVPDQTHEDGFNSYDREEIRDCFDEWCSLVPGRLSFKFVDSPEKAQICFSQKSHAVELSYSRTVLAHTIPTVSGPGRWAVYPCDKASIEPLRFYPEVLSKNDKHATLRHTVFLHEIGHSLGIVGHSSHAGDLMFFSGANKLSPRDKATFRKIYEPGSIYKRAEQAMRARAKANDKYALLALALELEHHGTASPKEAQEVFRVVSQAAKLGSPKALLMLGWMYHDGNGVKRDLMEADHYFHLAKDKGNPSALLALANACERGDGEKQDIGAAERYFKEALRMDLSRAPIAYANFLCYQLADPKSVDTAVAFYKKDSAREQLESMLRLALLYEHGEGVEKNPAEAARLRKKAAVQVMRCKAQDADEYFSRGQSWAELGDSKKAIADFAEALRLKPDFRVGYTAKAAAEQTAGDNSAACRDMSKALKLDPNCVQAYLGRAYSNLGLGKAAEALKDSKSILERTSAPDNDRLYGLIVGSLACRMLHDEKQAELMLDEAAASCSERYWPGPIVSYLKHQINDEQFASFARGYSRSTEVRFYMAMQQSLKGNVNDAIANLAWVKENGDKTFYEYPVAVAQLERLQKSPSRGKY